jgi:capsular exopolysaccharide synthesis family protein
MVHSSAPIDTVIIKISVQNSDSYLASLLANAIARQFAITATSLEISDGVSGTQVKVSTVRESVPSLYPISPKKKINYLFALIFSFLISTGVGLLREIFDQTVKNESHCTKTLLGVIDFDSEADNKPICNEDVYSSRSESFRHIRINLLDTIANQKIKTIAISSSISGEGKSSFSANFAYSVALTGKKVCILECDMRRPSLSKLLVEFINPSINVTANYGMSKLLAANPTTVTLLSIKRNIIKVVFPGAKFDFIACGVVPEDPAELLTSRNLSKVLDRLKNNYDLIILDSPPTLPVGDALLVGKAADAVVLLAKAGVVRRKQLVNTIGFHENIGNNVIGFCLNMAPIIDRSHEYGYQSSKHDYDSTYSYYYQYKNRQKNPYAPLKSYSGDKKTFLEFLKQFKSN